MDEKRTFERLEKERVMNNRLSEEISKLQEENDFLVDTIKQHNLGKLTVERQKLLKEVAQSKKKEEEAESLKEEYQGLISNAEKKMADIDSEITAEADKIIMDERLELIRQKKSNEEAFGKALSEQKEFYEIKLKAAKNKNILFGIIIAMLVISTIIGFVL